MSDALTTLIAGLQEDLAAARADKHADWRDKAALASCLTAAIRQLPKPAASSSAQVARIVKALEPYPEALAAVLAAIGP